MKKIIEEFKKFVMRGNIVDMAVGVIVGSSFTAIVNALSNNVLKPVINWLLTLIFGANSLSEVYTFLGAPVYDAETGEINLAESIYIDWGAFINAVINFLLVAVVLFAIVKIVNTFICIEIICRFAHIAIKFLTCQLKEMKTVGL